MPGEQSREGWANTSLFASLVENFDWVLRGPIDQNMDCEKCQPYANGKPRTHGVDAIFTFTCPYTRRTRAVIVDGKRYTFKSVGGPATIKSWLNDSTKTALHARDSINSLSAQRNLPNDTLIDTVMVVWDCHEGWDQAKSKEWIKGIRLGHTPVPALSVFLSTKEHLGRLQTLSQFRHTVHSLEFLYSPEKMPIWSKTLTPELLHSSILLIRYQKSDSQNKIMGVLYFDTETPSRIRFLVKYLGYAGLLTHDNITIHVQCPQNELEHFENYFSTEFASIENLHGIGISKFKFEKIVRAPFES
ncbi:MAG: hypothetical protein KKA54_10755 [Proteobacteria bacterium]|nr:hypothetical protein [Pseudomonadota bacterium]